MGCNASKLPVVPNSSTPQKNTPSSDDEYVEDVVCKVQDLAENEMRAFDLDEQKILVIKQKGVISAVGAKCTHYGAPLVNSALGDGRLRCQWHGACFNILNGDIEDFPGMDSLPCYKVTIENDNVKVKAKRSELHAQKRIKTMAKKNAVAKEKYVVIGGGPSGATAVETLRQQGFEGDITIICKESYLPYDRVKVSKQMDFQIDKGQLRNDEFYKDNDIEVLKGVAATSVDTENNLVKLDNGAEIKYDKLYVATGSNPRKPNVPGKDLKNVVTLREYDDARYTFSQLNPDIDVVVVGSSFIGMESANFCVSKVKSVTVVGRSSVPFKATWGERIGEAIMKFFEKKNIKYIPNNGLKKINDNSAGAVSSVELNDGQILKCDLLICGIGSTFCTDFLKGSGISMRPEGSIEVNEFMQTNIPNVYCGGDIAYAPVWSHHNTKATIGHYPLAQYHGHVAGLNMAGKPFELKAVPYFWTMLFGKGVRYAGYGSYDDIIYTGNVEDLKFMAFFLKDDEVVSVTACGMDPLVSKFAEKLAQGKKLYRDDLKDDPLAWSKVV